jgi:polysaccharide pyruvyl transferase WcaK-like protein
MSPAARAVQSIDVAFQLPFAAPQKAVDGVLDIGVNVSALLFNGGYGGSNDYELEVDYAELMRRFIAEHAARDDVRVHLICHVFSERLAVDDDARLADALAREFPRVVRAPDFSSPSEAKAYIAGLDFLVAGRMHACIAAYSAGVPVVPVAYSRKFSGLFGGVLDYPYQVPVKGLSTEEALTFLNRCLQDRRSLKSAITEGHKVVASALGAYDAVLRDLFRTIAARP